jgi:hypothetical protein
MKILLKDEKMRFLFKNKKYLQKINKNTRNILIQY